MAESSPDPWGRARSAGMLGAEVWLKLVDADAAATADSAGLMLLTMTTNRASAPAPPPKRSSLCGAEAID